MLTRRWAFATAGLAAGFSGLAVMSSIVSGLALVVTEVGLVLVPLGATLVIVRRTPKPIVHELWLVARAGLLAGFGATIVYDITRTALSILDPSPYNPFEAIRRFGIGMLGPDAPTAALMAAGLVIHFVNGSSFGVIYATFAGRHARRFRAALLGGIAWGLTLEFIQSILYPGWLNITTVLSEFLIISGLGHVAYGATLGAGVRHLLFRRGNESTSDGRTTS